jgi:hypothetical protein
VKKVARQRSYEKLWMTAEPLATKVALLIKGYQPACGANAKTADLLKEYEIVLLPKTQPAGPSRILLQ